MLNEAFSPWQLPGKSASDRCKSLQSILEQASEAGIMLFQQRSVYVFDWSNGDPFVVAPALVKEFDEDGEALKPAEEILQAA